MMVSFHVDSTIKIEGWKEDIFPAAGCLSVSIVHSMRNKWGDTVYSAGELSLHGTRDDIRAFAQCLIDAANGKDARVDQFANFEWVCSDCGRHHSDIEELKRQDPNCATSAVQCPVGSGKAQEFDQVGQAVTA